VSRGPKRNAERESRMCSLYAQGFTLAEIGTVYSMTRERVRQILKRAGMSSSQGGASKRAQRRKLQSDSRRQIRLNLQSQAQFGCDHATLLALNDGQLGYARASKARAFISQRTNARKRGIEWEMTFPEWWSVWEESGRYEQRGRRGDLYVMARRQDFGPYAAWNVYITTMSQNAADYQAELKRRGVACADGYKRLPERAKSLGASA